MNLHAIMESVARDASEAALLVASAVDSETREERMGLLENLTRSLDYLVQQIYDREQKEAGNV